LSEIDRPREEPPEGREEQERKPHPFELLILVAFPFLLMAAIALLYSWLTG
jgi:hypothetical protein